MSLMITVGLTAAYCFYRKKQLSPKYMLFSLLLTAYLSLAFSEILGLPFLREWQRLLSLEEGLLHPTLNWLPFSGGLSRSDLFNILLFIPLGVAVPVLWPHFNSFTKTLVYGMAFSLFIEFSQIFTLYRVSDISDLLTNTAGTALGWLSWRYIFRFKPAAAKEAQADWWRYPLLVILTHFFFGH